MPCAKTQDLPPDGGYQKIRYVRVPPKTYFSGAGMIVGYLGITAGAAYLFYLNCKQVHLNDIEQRSACLALVPLLLAERDREFLRQLRRNRDEEAKLMANVEGWKVGTWYGDKIYNCVPDDTLITPRIYEYYAHSNYSDYKKRAMFNFWS